MDNEKIEDNDCSGLIERIRFKPVLYDKETNYERLEERISGCRNILFPDKNIRVWKYFAVAASIALFVVSVMHFVDPEPRKELVWYETTAVPDAKTKIVLPDSSVVLLKAKALLR
jgi:hypothetical protein